MNPLTGPMPHIGNPPPRTQYPAVPEPTTANEKVASEKVETPAAGPKPPQDIGHQRKNTESSISVSAGRGPEPLNIIILGASFGGLSCAHHFLDYTLHRLRTTSTAPNYRLIIVSPSTHIYWNIGAPRALVKGGLLKHEDTFIPIEPGFARHKGLDYTIVQGKALEVDPELRNVKIECFNFEAQKRCSYLMHRRNSKTYDPSGPASQMNRIQTLDYHALIMCTGTSADSDLLSLHGPHLETADALNRFHTQVNQAKSIVVCGGGTSGVEVAGQLATFLNHTRRGPFQRRIKTPKQIILITGGERCLPGVSNPKVGANAEKYLTKLGVEVKHNVRVLKAQEWFDQTGATRIDLSDDTQLITDVYVPCTGVRPNSDYMPTYLKDEKNYILTNNATMRVDLAGDRVYALGDVASYSQNYVPDVYAAVPVVMHNMLNDLLAYELHLASPYGGNADRIEQLVDEHYAQRPNDSQLCPMTRFGGVGILLGLKLPKLMVHLLKGHDYRVCKAKGVVVDGGNPYAVPVTPGKYE